jgi:hypothetical protein
MMVLLAVDVLRHKYTANRKKNDHHPDPYIDLKVENHSGLHKGTAPNTVVASGSVQMIECLLRDSGPKCRSTANDTAEIPVRMVT